MRKKLVYLTLALAAFAAAQTGLTPVSSAEAACFQICCSDFPTRCVTCCPRCPPLFCP
jgi:hypothetical protein